ncbi:UspA [Salix suchowensis]|nr:UspA [Salix suchowensis]
MPSSGSFLRQLSGRSTSWRWGAGTSKYCTAEGGYNCERSLKQMEGLDMYGNENAGLVMRKRVVVVVDQTSHSKHAMMWALTHVANKGDLLTLLHIIPPGDRCSGERASDSHSPYLASSLGSLCKASRPEVEVEALVIQGPKLSTVISQVKKLEVSVLVWVRKGPPHLSAASAGQAAAKILFSSASATQSA